MGDHACQFCGSRFGNIPSWKQHEYECANAGQWLSVNDRPQYLQPIPRMNGKNIHNLNAHYIGIEMEKLRTVDQVFQGNEEDWVYDPVQRTYTHPVTRQVYTEEQLAQLYVMPPSVRIKQPEPNDKAVIEYLAEVGRERA